MLSVSEWCRGGRSNGASIDSVAAIILRFPFSIITPSSLQSTHKHVRIVPTQIGGAGMGHTDDAYAAMLLTMALSPNKEEYARPLSTAEFRRFEAAARESQFHGIGKLMDMDISGLMIYLNLTEEEAYRAFTLLHRGVQLSYALEGFAAQGIEVVTQYDGDYPDRLRRKLGAGAPPAFYRCGNMALLDRPAVAIVGISGVRTTPQIRAAIETLVRGAVAQGYGILTGGEPGVSHMAAQLVAELGGSLVNILGGGMREHLADDGRHRPEPRIVRPRRRRLRVQHRRAPGRAGGPAEPHLRLGLRLGGLPGQPAADRPGRDALRPPQRRGDPEDQPPLGQFPLPADEYV